MAKLYDFRFIVRRVEYGRFGTVAVPYGSSDDVYHEECAQLTLKAALTKQQELSAAEPRSHAAQLFMKYQDDRKPAGFDKAARTVYHKAAE